MSKREDQKLAALIRKHAGKTPPPRKDKEAQYDSTLLKRPAEQDDETKKLFKEMKRREF
ncbi:MAG TPA: hypothetical protein VEI47_09365 [Gemmatimonadales bacterium]|nr:hypothetical protein [Gemmatimonadales bacterium]